MPEKPNLASEILPSLQDPIYTRFLETCGDTNALHLDVGAGTGENLIYSTSLGLRPVGVEYDHDYAAQINGECVQGTATCLPFDDSAFDVVSLMHVLEHLPRYEETLGEIYRVLKPGGYFIVEVPNKYYIQEFFNAIYTRWVVEKEKKHLGHCNYFTFKRLKALLEKHGFVVIQHKTYGGLLHGTVSALIRLALDILLKGIIHRRSQDCLDHQRVRSIERKLSGLYNLLYAIDKKMNSKTFLFVEIIGFVCQKGKAE